MGVKIKKEVISPGRTFYVDERTGKPAFLDATPEMIRHYHDEGNAMVKDGLVIPVPYEHQLPNPPMPMSRAEYQKSLLLSNAGEVEGYEICPEGKLWANVDIADPEVQKKVGHTIKWTSPYFTSFKDGLGKDRKNVIAHLALTTRPRIVKQAPFPTVAAALSLATPAAPPEHGFATSIAGRLTPEGRPEFPRAFSLYAGVPLALEDMKEGPEKKAPPKPEGGKKPPPKEGGGGRKPPPEEAEDEYPDEGHPDEAPEKALIDKKGDISVYHVLCDLLPQVGIELPDCDSKNFVQELYKAVMAKVVGKSEELPMDKPEQKPPEKPAAPTPSPAKPSPVVQEQAPLYMSLDDIEKIESPREKSMALALHSLQDQAIKSATAERERRVAKLLKSLPPSARKRLEERVKASPVALSMGGAVDPLDETLTLLEESARDWPAMLSAQQPATQQPHPEQPPEEGVMTEERRQELVERQVASRGGFTDKEPEKKKAS